MPKRRPRRRRPPRSRPTVARAREGKIDSRVTNTVSVERHASGVDRVAESRASNRSRDETLTTPPSRVRDVTAAATRARVGVDRRSRGGFRGGRRSRDRFESGAKRGAREIGDAPRTRRRRTRSLRHLGPSSRVRVPRDSVSQRPGRCDSRTTTGVERRGAGRATIRGARADVPMHWSETRRALRVCGGDARARRVAGATVQADKCFVYARGRKPRFWITPSRLKRATVICGVSPGSLTLGRAECSHRDSPRSCRGSRARSASTADARSTPLAPLAPEHACVPAGVVDPDTDASFRRVPFSSETAATASGPPPA